MTNWKKRAWGALVVLTLFLVGLSFLPLWWTDLWWVRQWDFPRLQVAALLVVAALAFLLGPRGKLRLPMIGIATAALAWQGSHFVPYFRPWPKQVKGTEQCRAGRQISLLNANVLLTNKDFGRLLNIVEAAQPDVLLLLEPGPEWERAIEPLLTRYRYRLSEPLRNTYGMILLSRLPMAGRIEYILQPGVPSAHVRVRLIGGEQVMLHALHPEPPWPGDDSGERDAELVTVGRRVREEGRAAIVMGDLNDVAWSRTSRLFREVGGMGDPRIGRGFYPTFNANYPLLRWPLDHLFVSPHFEIMRIDLLPDIGSDHLPILFRLCLTEQAEDRKVAPKPPPATAAEATGEVRSGLAENREENRAR